ncbi:multidrug effflux MFS transporter [Salinisphaera sp. SWV1]|uniref:multidrug effflux MFS transporter n=1 Tax=Salinisphaera sp. SWV1 TaxID=3454139 RepID=UPI003F86C78C
MTASSSRIPQPSLALLALMMAVGPFGDTEYTPAMPDIAHALSTDYGLVQFTMAAYLFGDAVGEVCYGPLSDRFGRRPVALVGAGILSLGALLCLVSVSIWPLIGGRLIQGIGACAGGVMAKAMVRDAFEKGRRERIYAKLNAAFSLAPAVGPVVGSLIAHAMNWHVNFAVLLGLSLTLWALVWFFLPETNFERNPRALEWSGLWQAYRKPLVNKGFLFHAGLSGLCIGVVYSALIGAPDLVINVLHLGSIAVVIVALVVLVGFAGGAGACALASSRLRDPTVIGAGLALLLIGSLASMAVAFIVGKQGNLAEYLGPVAVCFPGIGLIMPVSTAQAMAPFKDIAGAASSLLGFMRMLLAALGTMTMALLHQSSVYDMPIVFLGLTAAAIVVFALFRFTGSARRERARQ